MLFFRKPVQVHFLPCSTCCAVFPGSEMKFCRHHRLDAASSDVDLLLASDTYPCCGARALKFSPLPVRNVRAKGPRLVVFLLSYLILFYFIYF